MTIGRRASCGLLLALMFLPALSKTSYADPCVGGLYSTLAGTTCETGNLQLTFGSLTGQLYINDALSRVLTGDDFLATMNGAGFGLTFTGQQSWAPGSGESVFISSFVYFDATALPGYLISGVALSGDQSIPGNRGVSHFDTNLAGSGGSAINVFTNAGQTNSLGFIDYHHGTDAFNPYLYSAQGLPTTSLRFESGFLNAGARNNNQLNLQRVDFLVITEEVPPPVTPVPEPATIWLLLSGVVMLAGGVKRSE